MDQSQTEPAAVGVEVGRGLLRSLSATACIQPSAGDHPETMHAEYALTLSDVTVKLHELVGRKLRLDDLQDKACVACGRARIRKTFGPGYCFPCFRSRPEADLCIVRPERCHFAQGTCRDAAWGQQHCMQSHSIYLSFTSQVKVGLSRSHRLHQRWLDQGALGGVELARVSTRLDAGRIEVYMKQFFKDTTQPRKMLMYVGSCENYAHVAQVLAGEQLKALDYLHQGGYGSHVVTGGVKWLRYPMVEPEQHSKDMKLVNLASQPSLEGVLSGIKGQYLLLDSGYGFSIRKHLGHYISLRVD